jgi:hypothetical protein
MTGLIEILLLVVVLGVVFAQVYLVRYIVNATTKERIELVKMAKSKDLKEYEYIMADTTAIPDKDNFDKETELVDLEEMPDDFGKSGD